MARRSAMSLSSRTRNFRPSPEILNDFTRREFIVGSGAALLLGTAGCGDNESSDGNSSADTRTIEHKYGSTEIGGRPERVVTVGWIEQDAVLALGIVPLATTEWFGDHPGAIFPWAQEKLGDGETPQALDNINGLKFESIAALEPDVILALYSDMSRDDYETLAEIAPTVAQPKEYEDLGVPWQDLTRTVGLALGRSEEADRLVREVEMRFDEVQRENPDFVGATALNVYPSGEDVYDAYPPPDLGGRLLEDLGFETPKKVLDVADGRGTIKVSSERLDLFEVDALVWSVENSAQRDELRENPLYAQLDVARQGRDIFLDHSNALADAMSVQTVLSLPFLLDGLVPRLTDAVSRDSSGEATS